MSEYERGVYGMASKLREILIQRSAGEQNTWGFVAAFMEMIDEAEKAMAQRNKDT